MRLYTVCVDQRPVLVISVGTELPMPDWVASNPELLKAQRFTSELREKIDEPTRIQMEIDRALSDDAEPDIAPRPDGWLREELLSMTYQDAPLWDGKRASLHIREARLDEGERWYALRRVAINAGDQDPEDEDFVALLLDVERTDDDWEPEED